MPLKTSEPSGTSQSIELQSICTRTFRNLPEYLNLTDYLHGKPPQPHQVSASEPSKTWQGTVSAPKPSGTSPATCTLTFWNLPAREPCATSLAICNKPLKPHQVSAPEPTRTSPFICNGTLRNLNTVSVRFRLSALEPSETSPGICTGILRNLNRASAQEPFRNPPELCPEPVVEAAPDSTRANLG